jgi:hypothetical protein
MKLARMAPENERSQKKSRLTTDQMVRILREADDIRRVFLSATARLQASNCVQTSKLKPSSVVDNVVALLVCLDKTG